MIRFRTAVVAAVFLVVFTAPSISSADKGGGHHVSKTKVEATLLPCCGNPEPNAHGDAQRATQSKDGALKADSFKTEVEIPVPSAGLGITDPTTADIRVVLSRAGADYAVCFLKLDDDNEMDGTDDDQAGADFQVKVALKIKDGTPVIKSGKGQCDVDLVTPDIQPGVPDVLAGDVATVSVFHADPAPATPFLQGTFVQHH
jgi:hypothetical protein